MKLSARNTLPGKITELQLGGVMAHVVAEEQKSRRAEEQKSRRAEEMNLKVGDIVAAVIKSTEVMLQKG